MNINDEPKLFFPCCHLCEGGERSSMYPPPGNVEALSIFRIFPVKFRKRYQSHFEALGRHLFVRDAERCTDDCANSSNPTYSRSLHKHAQHVLPNICHFPQLSVSLESVSAKVESALWQSEVLIEVTMKALWTDE